MSPSIFIRHHKLTVAASFIAASAFAMCWEAVPACATMTVAPQSVKSAGAPPSLVTPVCRQKHCFTYEQYMRPGFNPKKETPRAAQAR